MGLCSNILSIPHSSSTQNIHCVQICWLFCFSRRLITLTTTSTHRNANTISPWRGHYLARNNTSAFWVGRKEKRLRVHADKSKSLPSRKLRFKYFPHKLANKISIEIVRNIPIIHIYYNNIWALARVWSPPSGPRRCAQTVNGNWFSNFSLRNSDGAKSARPPAPARPRNGPTGQKNSVRTFNPIAVT